jgi:hypothetical protein
LAVWGSGDANLLLRPVEDWRFFTATADHAACPAAHALQANVHQILELHRLLKVCPRICLANIHVLLADGVSSCFESTPVGRRQWKHGTCSVSGSRKLRLKRLKTVPIIASQLQCMHYRRQLWRLRKAAKRRWYIMATASSTCHVPVSLLQIDS